MIFNTEISTDASGYSYSITLEPGLWNIFATAPSWTGTSTVQVSSNDVDFIDLKDNNGDVVVFSANSVEEVNGGVILRVNNSLAINDFYLVAKKAI